MTHVPNTTADYAQAWRDDLREVPTWTVLQHARSHLVALRQLPEATPDRDAAILDFERFIGEHPHYAN